MCYSSNKNPILSLIQYTCEVDEWKHEFAETQKHSLLFAIYDAHVHVNT